LVDTAQGKLTHYRFLALFDTPRTACYRAQFREFIERGHNIVFANIDPVQIVLSFIVFLFSLSVHESAHALVSDRFGDDLGRSLGRISLNPIVHIDPLGTILFPLIGAITHAPVFGWAKPVPVNPLAWREKDKANFWVSAAGPLSNFALAIICFLILKAFILTGVVGVVGSRFYIASTSPVVEPLVLLVFLGLTINLTLGLFNLIPVPPLDGGGMLESILPREAQRSFEQIKLYGFMNLFALILLGAFTFIFAPVEAAVMYLLRL
jgi:Zn-dependent protease